MENILFSYLTDPFFAGCPSLPGRTEWVTIGDKRILTQIPLPTDKRLVPAKIGILAELSRENFCMSADMSWLRGDDPLHLCFGTAQLCRGSESLAAIAWPGILDGLRCLQAKLPASVLVNTEGPVIDGMVNVSHQYFVETNGNEEQNGTEDVINGMLQPRPEQDDLFSLLNWPAHSVARRQSLLAMKDHFKPNPLPVFDNTGRLLRPGDYERSLKGAFVAMEVILTHQVVAASGIGLVIAHIDRIEILRKPLPVGKSLTACRMPYDLNEANVHYNTVYGTCNRSAPPY